MISPLKAFQAVASSLLDLVHTHGSEMRYADLLAMLPHGAAERKRTEMTTQSILENVLAHRMDSEQKHPDQKTRSEWISCLEARLAIVIDELEAAASVRSDLVASKAAAQLAGMCVRLIEQMNWPLVEPSGGEG